MGIRGGFTNSKGKRSKSKGERERYIQLNSEFPRMARRDMKAFLNEQCKEIEESNRMEKTRDLLKKIGNIRELVLQRCA